MMDPDDGPETFEVNRDVEAEIYAVKYSRLAGSPAARLHVTLSLDAVQHQRLCALLGVNLKGQAKVHFFNIQAPLPDEPEEEPEPAQKPLQAVNKETANRGRQTRTHQVAGNGEALLAHRFKADEAGDPTLCQYCLQGSGAEIHAAHAGLPADSAGEVAASLIEESRRDVPEDQRLEAEAALAARAGT